MKGNQVTPPTPNQTLKKHSETFYLAVLFGVSLQSNRHLVILIKSLGAIFTGWERQRFPQNPHWFRNNLSTNCIYICTVLRSVLCLSSEPCTREPLHFGDPVSLMCPCLCLLGEGPHCHVFGSVLLWEHADVWPNGKQHFWESNFKLMPLHKPVIPLEHF